MTGPPPMIRPDGTGEPTQQELDQAFPPQYPRSNRNRASRSRVRRTQPGDPRSVPPADPPQPRPDPA